MTTLVDQITDQLSEANMKDVRVLNERIRETLQMLRMLRRERDELICGRKPDDHSIIRGAQEALCVSIGMPPQYLYPTHPVDPADVELADVEDDEERSSDHFDEAYHGFRL